MKRNSLHTSSTVYFFGLVTIIGFMLLVVTSTAVAQTTATAPPPPISTADLPQISDWKAPVDYAAVVASERVNAALILASPTSKELVFSLYTGYDRMLSYMQADMIAGVPIEKIAENNFTKVNQEAPADPVLVNMETPSFQALYDALLVMLHQ